MILVLLPGTFVEFQSVRTGEVLLDARRIGLRHLIVSGNASRDRYNVGLDGDDVRITGTLWDRRGPVASFGESEVRFHAPVMIRTASLPVGYDGTWRRDET